MRLARRRICSLSVACRPRDFSSVSRIKEGFRVKGLGFRVACRPRDFKSESKIKEGGRGFVFKTHGWVLGCFSQFRV